MRSIVSRTHWQYFIPVVRNLPTLSLPTEQFTNFTISRCSMLIGIVCQQITILVSIPLSIVVLMYICSVSSGVSRHIMLLYSVLHCACIQLLRNIYMKDYLLLYAFCCEFFSCRFNWIPSPCQLLPQVEIAIEGCSQFKFLSGEMLFYPACSHRQAL